MGGENAQKGILEEINRFGLFIVLKAIDPKKNGPSIARHCAKLSSLIKTVHHLDPSSGLSGAVSFGSDFWDIISPGKRPKHLHPFHSIESGERRAPRSGGDILFHIHSGREDLNFELARRMNLLLEGSVTVLEEVHGFSYLDSRDLTGFIDGTANPQGEERSNAALIGSEDPEFKDGSYVLTQRYVHNLSGWETLSEKDQEKIIGRRKKDSEELGGGEKAPTAHISRVEIEEGGEELKILRHSLPYGKAMGESGLFFLAYAKNSEIFEKMLNRMFGVSGDGVHDHLMDFSQPVSGALFFSPSLNLLKSFSN
ncbi:MAG TPA: Dyp-type peroxidase [Nitrospiria bacterium]|jgi:putative iron-dependent peroxidase